MRHPVHVLYYVISSKIWRFPQILVAFSEYMNIAGSKTLFNLRFFVKGLAKNSGCGGEQDAY